MADLSFGSLPEAYGLLVSLATPRSAALTAITEEGLACRAGVPSTGGKNLGTRPRFGSHSLFCFE